MLDTDKVQLLFAEAEIINSIISNEVDIDKIYNYLNLVGAVAYREKLDVLFELFYDKLNAIDIDYDFRAIFNNIAAIEGADTLEIDKDVIVGDKQSIANAYADFLVFINTDLESQDLEIETKLQNLLKINKNLFPKNAEIKRLYLFFVLNIAMAQPLIHMAIINSTVEELKQLMEE